MSVKVRVKRGKLYLDIYQSGKRTWEALHLTLTKDREQNKAVMRIADICRSQRESQLLAGAWNIQDPVAGKQKFIAYAEKCAKSPSNSRSMKGLLYHLKNFHAGETVLLSQITPKWVADFQEYLEKSAGLSPSSAAYYSKILRMVLRKAVKENIITRDPSETVKRLYQPETDLVYLNIDEAQRLADTKIDDCDGEIRRAFLFACHTGLRVCDLETLVWGQIETSPMQIVKRQEKTKIPVYIPLSETAKRLIDDGKEHAPAEKVFVLPHDHRRQSYYVLKRWREAAGVTKNIGWHTARRTFATLALENGVDIYTVAKLLGHTSISQVAKYAKVTDRLRREAVAALPEIRL
ncbi:MAG: site-specific integrase [Spirochaetaceae bacterium]|nr:site-specific integrase [Spirochaetaceae bacterium]